MRILGIDPGIRCTGYGLISIDGGQPHLVDYGTIKPPPAATMGERLAVIYDDLDQLIDMTHPDEFAIEEAFHGVNARSALILGQSRGAALVCAAHHHLPIGQYAPRRVKIATTGRGRATKEQVQDMVQRIPMGRTGEISEIAAMVAWLASEECSFSTGAVFDISGGRATY